MSNYAFMICAVPLFHRMVQWVSATALPPIA